MLKYQAVRTPNNMVYFKCGYIHRKDGPAEIWFDGDMFWSEYGQLHRKDGPAIKFAGGGLEYWIRGIEQC